MEAQGRVGPRGEASPLNLGGCGRYLGSWKKKDVMELEEQSGRRNRACGDPEARELFKTCKELVLWI